MQGSAWICSRIRSHKPLMEVSLIRPTVAGSYAISTTSRARWRQVRSCHLTLLSVVCYIHYVPWFCNQTRSCIPLLTSILLCGSLFDFTVSEVPVAPCSYGCDYAQQGGTTPSTFAGTPAAVACPALEHVQYTCPHRVIVCPCCGELDNPILHGMDAFINLTTAQTRVIVDKLDSGAAAAAVPLPLPLPPKPVDPSPMQGVSSVLSGPALPLVMPAGGNEAPLGQAPQRSECKYAAWWVSSCTYCRKSVFHSDRVQHEQRCALDYAEALKRLKHDQQVGQLSCVLWGLLMSPDVCLPCAFAAGTGVQQAHLPAVLQRVPVIIRAGDPLVRLHVAENDDLAELLMLSLFR